MTQCRDGISLAPKGARGLMGVARRLSVWPSMFVSCCAAAGIGRHQLRASQGSSSRRPDAARHRHGVELWLGVRRQPRDFTRRVRATMRRPFLFVKGSNTLLGAGTGPAGVSVSSLDDHIGVTVPIDLIDLTGFGGFPSSLACTSAGTPCRVAPGSILRLGRVSPRFSPGSDKNAAGNIIGTRNATRNVILGCTGVGTPFPCCTGPAAGTSTLSRRQHCPGHRIRRSDSTESIPARIS